MPQNRRRLLSSSIYITCLYLNFCQGWRIKQGGRSNLLLPLFYNLFVWNKWQASKKLTNCLRYISVTNNYRWQKINISFNFMNFKYEPHLFKEIKTLTRYCKVLYLFTLYCLAYFFITCPNIRLAKKNY